jgi:hypothetical protein
MTVFAENEILKITVFELSVKKVLHLKWKPTTAGLKDREYRENVLLYAACIESFKTELALIDTRNFLYTIPLETQEWINAEVFPKNIENGLSRMAIVVSPDFFAKLSVELTMSDNPNLAFQVMYFETEEAAWEWLKSHDKS